MSNTINYICNGCGRYATPMRDLFNIVKIDLKRYIAFSSGYIPKTTEIEIHFCNECFSKIHNSKLHYSTDGSFDVVLKENEKLNQRLHELEEDFEAYKRKIKSLLQPVK